MMIQVTNLTKKYGRLTALDGVNFRVAPGEAVALWGANGAGKTTVLRCLLNLVPFAGNVRVAGLDVTHAAKAVRRQIGFVPQSLTFHDDLTVTETLEFYSALKRVTAASTHTALLQRLALAPHLGKRVGELSGGLKQRLALVLALLADPPLLLLDEPTASLDVAAREDFLELLRGLKAEGKTLVFTSHRLEEMASLADRVLYLVDGHLTADCPPNALSQQLGWHTQLHLALPAEQIEAALAVMGDAGLAGQRNGHGICVSVPAGGRGRPLRLLHQAGIEVIDFSLD